MVEKFFCRIRGRRLRKGRSGKLPAMIVRAANEYLLPRFRVCWRKVVTIGKLVDLLRRYLLEKSLSQLAKECVAQAIDTFEMLKEKDELLDMACLKFPVHAVEGMRDCVGNLSRLQIALQLKDIIAHTLDVAMLLFRDSPNKDMHLA